MSNHHVIYLKLIFYANYTAIKIKKEKKENLLENYQNTRNRKLPECKEFRLNKILLTEKLHQIRKECKCINSVVID